MLKIYSYPGISSAVINIPVGRAFVKCKFVDGNPDARIAKPAVLKTTSKAVQQIIEHNPMFGKTIFLYAAIGEEEVEEEVAVPIPASTPKPAISVAPEASVEEVEYPEVTNWEEAVALLKSLPGVKAQQLRTVPSAMRVAKAHGVVFPNYNFE